MLLTKAVLIILLYCALVTFPAIVAQAEISTQSAIVYKSDSYGQIGDSDGSGGIDIDDVIFIINYVFTGGDAPSPLCTGDADGSGKTDIDDVVYLIVYVFGGGPPPMPLGPVIPRPFYCECADSSFELTIADTIWVQSGLPKVFAVGQYLAEKINPSTGFDIKVRSISDSPSRGMSFKLNPGSSYLGSEGYELTITSDLVTLEAFKEEGLFRGVQTIRQLFPAEIEDSTIHGGPWDLPCGHVIDFPKFQWRGHLLDVVRHFFSVDMVKEYIDLLAYYKMNIFHLHLTDDQGWRIESKRYPMLNEIGSWRGDDNYGGFFTKEEIDEIIEYASARYITVVPEIDVPGHSIAAIVSYPWIMCDPIIEDLEIPVVGGIYETILCPGKDSTLEFLKGVLDEVVELFPSSVIHIGGDEVLFERWENCPRCQARMIDLGLSDEYELQEWFMKEISWYLHDTHGRTTSGWSEGGICQDSMPPERFGQWWGPGDDIASLAADGKDVVNTSYSKLFLDRWFCKLQEIYEYDINSGTDSTYLDHIIGAETALWTEYVVTESDVAEKTFPRLIAFAENVWTDGEYKNYVGFYARLLRNLENLNYMGIDYGEMEE